MKITNKYHYGMKRNLFQKAENGKIGRVVRNNGKMKGTSTGNGYYQ
jgi:hypothetical protein